MRMLIVDDETYIRKGVVKLLQTLPHKISLMEEARNGQEALGLIDRLQPDVVLTDIQMPVMDGFQLIERARRGNPHIEWIILSGYAEFDYVQRALRNEVADYLLKPVTMEGLESVISRLLLKDPARWIAELDLTRMKRMKDAAEALVKGVMSENRDEVRETLDRWFAYCSELRVSLLEWKQLSGHLDLFFRSELFLTLNVSPWKEDWPVPHAAASSAELEGKWREYMEKCIGFVSERRAPRNKRIVDQALAEIEARYGDPDLNLTGLAERAGVSNAYMSKIFRDVMKKPITQYITEYRLERAKRRLIEEHGKTIAEAADLCGFADYPYFSKIFKRYFGVSPLEYKEKHGGSFRKEPM